MCSPLEIICTQSHTVLKRYIAFNTALRRLHTVCHCYYAFSHVYSIVVIRCVISVTMFPMVHLIKVASIHAFKLFTFFSIINKTVVNVFDTWSNYFLRTNSRNGNTHLKIFRTLLFPLRTKKIKMVLIFANS